MTAIVITVWAIGCLIFVIVGKYRNTLLVAHTFGLLTYIIAYKWFIYRDEQSSGQPFVPLERWWNGSQYMIDGGWFLYIGMAGMLAMLVGSLCAVFGYLMEREEKGNDN